MTVGVGSWKYGWKNKTEKEKALTKSIVSALNSCGVPKGV